MNNEYKSFRELIEAIAEKNPVKSEFLGVLDIKDIKYTVNKETIRVYDEENENWIVCIAMSGHIIVR